MSDDALTNASEALETLELTLRVNGKRMKIVVPPAMSLLELLRDSLNLRGTKLACSRAVCGSCTVLVLSLIHI